MIRRKTATNYVNYQERAKQFSPGDYVTLFGDFMSVAGRVTAVYPGIGMVDVENSRGNKRYPVEELQLWNPETGNPIPPVTNSIADAPPNTQVTASAKRVALYWAQKDRQYRMCKEELSSNKPCCPKCGPEFPLSKTNYKRREGQSESLLGCHNCLFLIKADDIINLGGQ